MFGNLVTAFFIERWPWWAGGFAIGLLVPVFYYCFNTALGVSTGYGNLVKILLRPKNLQWLNSEKFADTWGWRLFFIMGMILGGTLSSVFSGEFMFATSMGQLTHSTDWSSIFYILYFFMGGLLLGLGARIAGGCTSGHSIHGMANLHRSSIYITLVFIVSAVLSANLLRIVIMRGG